MKSACFLIIFGCQFLIAALAFSQEKPDATPVSGDIEWVFDIEEGRRLSRETGKPQFIVFRCER